MSMYDCPERPLEPPEDRRPVYGRCACCEEEIREGDDCWDFRPFGGQLYCEYCADDAHKIEVEVE
jgi:hypothetical protein